MRLLLLLLVAASSWAADYDWLFRNARVVDGTGNPWFLADVAVADGRIAAVGRFPNADASRIVDASGLVLAPGFIDIHTHIEQTIAAVPLGDNFVFDGVTTVVTGNCGGSKVELSQWFAELEEAGIGLNIASLIGHNSVRAHVVGGEARAATPEELEEMAALVGEGMKDGAVGFSTGLIYVPGTYAETAEVIALAKVASQAGGIYASHIRNEENGVLDAISEAVEIGREADIPVQIAHFKISSRKLWGKSDQTLGLIEKARREGIDIRVDQYPYDRSSTSINVLLPTWVFDGGREAALARLRDAETRAKIAAEMEEMLVSWGFEDYSYSLVAECRADPSLEGRNISEINRMRGREASVANEILTIMEILNQGGASMIYHKMSSQDVERILSHPFTAVASDGGTRIFGKGKPHPRSYGTNARVLATYVREKKLLTLEDAIRRMTSLPASTMGFHDRGIIRPGFAADLALFDPERVRDNATFQDPHRFSDGFELVLVNGEAVVEDRKLTGKRPGRILRRIPR